MIQNSLRILLISMILIFMCCAMAPAQKITPLPELTSKRLLNDLHVTVAGTPYLGKELAIGLVVRYGSVFDLAAKKA